MKKATSMKLLASALSLSLLLAACGGDKTPNTTKGGEETTKAAEVQKTDAPDAETTESQEEAQGSEAPEIKTDRDKDQLIYGSSTEISGDWAHGAYWTNNATDNMIRGLINDYNVITTDREARFIVNKTVAKSVESEMNEDGTKTYTVEIQPDLVFNDGSPITAENFVASLMLFSHPTLKELGAKSSAPLTYVGGKAFQDGESETFAGVRLLDTYKYSLTVNDDKVPYYYDITYASLDPLSIDMWLGEGYGVKDDGEGCYFVGDMSKEAIGDRIEEVRFKSEGRITAGPYNLVSYNVGSKQAVLEINDKYKGNFEGVKPSIKRLVIVKAEDATQFDALATGEIDLLSQLTGGEDINKGLDLVEAGGFATVDFDRAGYGKLMFQCDFGPTQFLSVRHAIAHLLDRQEFANKFTKGFGSVVNGPYGIAQWMYQEAEEELDEKLDEYSFSVDEAIKILEEDGWNLDENGNEYKEGVRWKKVTEEEAGDYEHNKTLDDGTILMPLIIEWSSTEGNEVSELLATMLANDTAPKAGFQINQSIMTFQELLNWMYRDKSVGDQYGVPKYGMYNLASNFTPIYDYAYNWTSDPEMVEKGWNTNYFFDDKMDQLSMDMVYGVESGDDAKFLELWVDYIEYWNQMLPEIPLYSNIYYTIFRDDLQDYEEGPYWSFDQAIVYAKLA